MISDGDDRDLQKLIDKTGPRKPILQEVSRRQRRPMTDRVQQPRLVLAERRDDSRDPIVKCRLTIQVFWIQMF